MNRRLTGQSGVETFVVWTTQLHWNAASVANWNLVVAAWPRAERRNNLRIWRYCSADWARGNNHHCTSSPRTQHIRQVGRSAESRVWTRNELQQSSNARRANDADYCCRCSLLKLLNLDYIQHFSYGARGFMRVPVSEANDLNYLLSMN